MSEFISVHLGSEDGARRKGELEDMAERVGAIGQRGPSISKMMQLLADGEIEISRQPAIRARLKQALRRNMPADEANACRVGKGHEAEKYGWYYRPFNKEAVYLGQNEAEALKTIERIREVA